jgi:hypothetical protein
MKLVHGAREYDDYFKWKKDATRLVGFSSVQKCSTALTCLVYRSPRDRRDDYGDMFVFTCWESVYRFFWEIVVVFDPIHLKASNEEDTNRIPST